MTPQAASTTAATRISGASRRFSLLLVAVCAAVAALFGGQPGTALAHPLGNFTVNRYARIEIYGDQVRIAYVVDFAEIPTFQEMDAIDADNNGASPEELAVFAARLAPELIPGMSLSFGDTAVALELTSEAADTAVGQSNLPILRFVAEYAAPAPTTAK